MVQNEIKYYKYKRIEIFIRREKMALQTDSDEWTITTQQSNTESFNDTFDNAPVDLIVFAVTDKKKSMVEEGSITTTQADVGGESSPIRYLAKEPGYDAGSASTHPEMDSGTLQVAVTKTLEAVSFNSTFSSAPIVVTGYNGTDSDWKGGKTSAANITTTGCDVATEIKETGDNVNWFAIYTNGFWEV